MTTLKKGSRGQDVKTLQTLLHLYADGIFGILTEEAVKDYQRQNGLTCDGIVGPKTWAMLNANSTALARSRRTINEIIVHCTATPEGVDYTVDDIRRWHTAPKSKGGQGWSDIGYHYIVYRDGSVHDGRNINIAGAHCVNHNAHSIGVVYVGGCEKDGQTPKDTRTKEQRITLLKILAELRQLYPQAKIYGHRNFANKACPSFDAKTEYKNV